MPRKSSKYLEFYKKCMETGRLPFGGLCMCLDSDKDYSKLSLFHPLDQDEIIGSSLFWANGEDDWTFERKYNFTPLRQTIVLLMHELFLDEQNKKKNGINQRSINK